MSIPIMIHPKYPSPPVRLQQRLGCGDEVYLCPLNGHLHAPVTVLVLQKHKVLDVSYVQNLTLVTSQLYDTIPRWPTAHVLLCSL